MYSATASTLMIKKNKTFLFSLPSNLGQGYQWTLLDTTHFKILDHKAVSNPNKEESTDLEIFKLKGEKKGTYMLHFYYLRPFDEKPDTSSAKKISQPITIQ